MYTADMKVEDLIKGKTLVDTLPGNHLVNRNSINQETMNKLTSDMTRLKNSILEKKAKLEELHRCLQVEFDGDLLKGNYSIRLTHSPSRFRVEKGAIHDSIISTFINEYGLELEREIVQCEDYMEFLEALNKKEDYCEVDLFNRKEPVEC